MPFICYLNNTHDKNVPNYNRYNTNYHKRNTNYGYFLSFKTGSF